MIPSWKSCVDYSGFLILTVLTENIHSEVLVLTLKRLSKMEQTKSNSTVFKTIVVLLGLIIVGLVGYIAYDKWKINTISDEIEKTVIDEYNRTPTVDEAVEGFKQTVKTNSMFDRFVQLDPIIVKEIYTKIGTAASVTDVMNEYDSNQSYYISLQIANQLKEVKINGPDANKIKALRLSTEIDSTDKSPKMKITPYSSKDTIGD